MIELSNSGALTGYLGLDGLKFLNYLWSRVKLLSEYSENYTNLKSAISLMDQLALAPGIITKQLSKIRTLSPNQYYYTCYYKLFNVLSSKMKIEVRKIPLSSSACYFNEDCDDSCDSDGECCTPNV